MAEMRASLERNMLECPICTEIFTQPKCLPCLHTFCESCLQTYLKGLTTKCPLVDGFPCPVCREPTPAPAADIPCDKWAGRYPTNHLIVTLQDTLSVQQRDKECSPCALANKHEVAVGWCQTCDEWLCQTCNDYHQRFKMTSKHAIVSI
jgi:hypothetical protein